MNITSTKIFRSTAVAAVALFGVVVLSFAPASAYAEPTSAEVQAQAQSALASLNAMSASLDEASNTYYTALAEVEEAQAKMDEAQSQINQESAHIADLQGKLGTRARSMYRSGSAGFLDVLLGSTSWEAFTSNWDILTSMNVNDAQMVGETKASREALQASKDEYQQQKDVAQQKTDEAEATKQQAEATVAQIQAVYDGLSAEAAQLLAEEQAAQAAAEAAQAAAVVEAASAQAAAEASGSSDSSDSSDSSTSTGSSQSQAAAQPSYDASTGNTVVDRAYGWVGRADYVWGACSPGAFDCSGFVSYCLTGRYSRLGTTYTFLGWTHVSDPQPGDVAVNSGHCGIYIGGGQMVHAATEGVGVIVGPVQGGMVFVRY